MKYIIISFTFLVAMLSSCNYVSKIADTATGMQMDGESAYTKAAEVLGKVDPHGKFIHSVSLMRVCPMSVRILLVMCMSA